jgi:hypothetical protein
MKQVKVVCEYQGRLIERFVLVMPEGHSLHDVLNQVYLQHGYMRKNEKARIYIDGIPASRKLMGQQLIKIESK